MKTFSINFLLCVLYILIGILLEKLMGFTSPALFAFYGFVMGAFSLLINFKIEEQFNK